MLFSKTFPVTCHTHHVGEGSTFVAIPGVQDDGTKYIKQAIAQGETTIVLEKKIKQCSFVNQEGAAFVFVDNARQALAKLSSQALGNPASKLKIIGITGTKGKTTTTYFIEHMLRSAGYKTALLGGVKNKILDKSEDSCLTTPSSDYLHMFFDTCVRRGVQYVVMEVSAHALSLQRVHGLQFAALGFTNLEAEHLDFYKTMDDYFQAKALLFSQASDDGLVIINHDDDWGKKLHKKFSFSDALILFGQQKHTALTSRFLIKNNTLQGLTFSVEHDGKNGTFECPALFGTFNAYNSCMAAHICLQLGLDVLSIQNALQTFPGVPGRLQLHRLKNGARAFVDYAHNPSSMDAVLRELRKLTEHLIIVFGCGGDRDITKRPVMGSLAARFADKVIVTDDNPRSEDSQKIIQEILQGIPGEKRDRVIICPDRAGAIAQAAALSCKDSVIALLGKGHEEYFLRQGKKIFFSDLQEISKF